MDDPEKKAWWISLALHLVVFGALVIAVVMERFRPEEEERHVFEMVEPPGETAEHNARPPESDPEEAGEPEERPKVKPMPDIPDPELPEEAPPREREPGPEAPAEREPEPEASEEPEPDPAPQRRETVSYEEFVRENPVRERRRPEQRERSRPSFEAPQINSERVRAELENLLRDEDVAEEMERLSDAEQNELRAYGARLHARLNRAWKKPADLAGIRLTARVEFDVSASGRITRVRLNPSSGNRKFDRSVLAAFEKVTSAGPTPTERSHSFSMGFRMVER